MTRAERQRQIAAAYQHSVTPRRRQRDGVVATPIEIVDYQIRSVIDLLAAQGVTLTDERVKILDPFGGTGIYLARLMQIAPLTPAEKINLATRCRMVEIDADACEAAKANLAAVMREETGQDRVTPTVIHADTFQLGDEVWSL